MRVVLSRANRLTSGAGFARTVHDGSRSGTGTLVLHLDSSAAPESGKSRPTGSGPLVGFVVGKSVGNAVTRNQVKRRLRHLLRARLGVLPPSGSLVVRARPAAARAAASTLGADLDSALARLWPGGRDR